MSTERAQRFTTRRDAETARPQLKVNNPVVLEQFADLVGDYKFPKADWIRCQLVDEKGRCRKLHGWGWIVQLKDKTEGYVGHDCAEDHFKADPRFAAMFAAAAARVDRQIETDALVARLGALLADTNLPSTVERLTRRGQRLSDRVALVRNLLNPKVLEKLTERTKRGNAGVSVRILYVDEEIDEKTGRRRKVVKPQEFRWGVLSGLEGLEYRPLSRIGARLAEARAAITEAVASVEEPAPSLRKWAQAIEYVNRAGAELDRAESLIENFCRLENVKLLWLLVKDRWDQLATVNAGLEIASRKRVNDEEASAALQAWGQEIRDAHGDRDFEIVS